MTRQLEYKKEENLLSVFTRKIPALDSKYGYNRSDIDCIQENQSSGIWRLIEEKQGDEPFTKCQKLLYRTFDKACSYNKKHRSVLISHNHNNGYHCPYIYHIWAQGSSYNNIKKWLIFEDVNEKKKKKTYIPDLYLLAHESCKSDEKYKGFYCVNYTLNKIYITNKEQNVTVEINEKELTQFFIHFKLDVNNKTKIEQNSKPKPFF